MMLFQNQIPPITGPKVEPIKAEENGILLKKEAAPDCKGNNGMRITTPSVTSYWLVCVRAIPWSLAWCGSTT